MNTNEEQKACQSSPIQLIIGLFMLVAGDHHGLDTKRKLITYFTEKDTELLATEL